MKNSQTCRHCENPNSVISPDTCCTGCSVLEDKDLRKLQWISVDTDLPKNGERVLAYAIEDETLPYLDCHYFEAMHYENCWTENVDCCRIHVTHWMPLPKPPKESENDAK